MVQSIHFALTAHQREQSRRQTGRQPKHRNPGGITAFLYDKGCSKNRPIEGAETICNPYPLIMQYIYGAD